MSGEMQTGFQSCFFTTKHSWRGKYKRLLAIGDTMIATFNPTTFEETNKWDFSSELVSIEPSPKSDVEFVVSVKKKDGKKLSAMTFSSQFRLHILTIAQAHRSKFVGNKDKPDPIYNAHKHHWSESRKEVLLSALPSSLAQVDSAGCPFATYNYMDISAICTCSDYPGGIIIITTTGRMHLFALDKRTELLEAMNSRAAAFCGMKLPIKKKELTLNQFRQSRFGRVGRLESAITSLAEFPVQKISPRHPDPVSRLFCMTETCIVERDPSSYAIVTLRELNTVFSIIRHTDDQQKFSVEYSQGITRSYLTTDRDTLLASLLDSVRATGNKRVCIQMQFTDLKERFQPLSECPVEEVESSLLKYLSTPNTGISFQLAVRRFNANVNYSGLVHAVTEDGWFKENKEKLIFAALTSLLQQGDKSDSSDHLAGEFQAIRRLVASKAGFQAFTKVPGFKEKIGTKVVNALRRRDDGLTYTALDTLTTLMIPMHDNYEISQEKLNKSFLLASKPFLNKLLGLLKIHADAQTGALVVSMLLDFFTFAIGSQYSETTDGKHFDTVLEMVAGLGRSLFFLFEHPSMAIVKAAGLIMKAIIEEGDEEMRSTMQALALAEGALLRHLFTALYTKSTDNRVLTHRQLSRHLVALWMEKNEKSVKLLSQIFPAGLTDALHSDEVVAEKDVDRMNVRENMLDVAEKETSNKKKVSALLMHWRSRTGRKASVATKPVTLRRRRELVSVDLNWDYFYFMFESDHSKSDLIWNFKTREELKECIDNEMRAFLADKDLRGKHVISWNHTEFEIRYETLAEEIKIGDHYLRLLLDDDARADKIHNPLQFFNDLYHRFLLTTKTAMKSMCLQAMSVVYEKCSEEVGVFNDTEFIVHMLNTCEDNLERDRLLQFLNVLLLDKRNVKLFIDAGGIRCLVDLVTLAHMHTTRATTPMQTAMLEASSTQNANDAKEWYYTMGDVSKKEGPVGYSDLQDLYASGSINKETKVWAQGMEGWRPMRMVPQLKWTLVAGGQGVMDLSALCVLCLNMLTYICNIYPSRDADDAIIRPLPRCKRMLTDAMCLPHIVQLLLTFDPIIVEKTSILLSIIMQDNTLLPRLYLKGVFFFILMYTGSNILPIARFLKQTHKYQAYQAEGDTVRSILSPMLPTAMICFLENHGPEKFASTFLGEFDTPEAIWSAEMRRSLIEKIALHLSDFIPRLQSNTRAVYQFCPIPKVSYAELENELFCDIFYLRHLCDEAKFPNWPIEDPVKLLKEVLEAWKVEVDKKPQTMSADDAYATLGLDPGQAYDYKKVRKAYFKMSMKFHPDKNPEGRDMFEKVNKAYEFISGMENRSMDGPNPENIVLVLRSQSILFKRFSDILQPYKYAGYPMLTITIQRETEDDNLFSSSVALLHAACELSYLTVKCSPLNAQEMKREGGFEKLTAALDRCLSVVSQQTSDSEPAVKVCTSILLCFASAAQFPECVERISEITSIVKDLSRCLWLEGAPTLTSAAIECTCSFSRDSFLQTALIQRGALWHIIKLLFGYDYTLDNAEIEKDESTHHQEYTNNNAKVGVRALAMLCGSRSTGESATPRNEEAMRGLSSLLTPFLLNLLNNDDPKKILKLFNGNSETPYIIWDNSTRAELSDFIEGQQESIIKHGEQDPSLGGNIVYSAHSDEVVVDDIFVRVYNEQPSYPIAEAQRFTKALLEYIENKAQFVWSASSSESAMEESDAKIAKALTDVAQALESLRNVIKANPGVETACIGHFRLLFSLLKQSANQDVQLFTLQIISLVAANRTCVKDIAASQVLVYLLFTLKTLVSGRMAALESLHALVSHNKCIAQLLEKGGLVYLLVIFCSGGSPIVRQTTAALFGKMLADKLHGPRVKIVLSKFLPPIFMDAVRDNSEASVTMFEGNHENPELIWNEEARERVTSTLTEMCEGLYQKQLAEPTTNWQLPIDYEIVYECIHGEVVVGGVFLRLLIAQPHWALRKPQEFIVALMEKYVSLISRASIDSVTEAQLETVATAFASLLGAQNDLASKIPSMGHLNKIIGYVIAADNVKVNNSFLSLFNQLSANTTCVRAIGQCPDSVKAFQLAIAKTESEFLCVGCEMLKRLYESNAPPLVVQALDTDFIPFLLDLLKSGLDLCDQASSAKAHVVKTLKAMTRDLGRGEEVTDILDKCPWWASYKDQRHDLFISNTSVAGYLTGPTANIAGYLTGTDTSTVAMSTAPPSEIGDVSHVSRHRPGNPDI
eukprot:m.23293 g.23293  ORF g.23293 m.23293 type:complete len:2228 (-) comp5537_c0_seq1:183-6866(-)